MWHNQSHSLTHSLTHLLSLQMFDFTEKVFVRQLMVLYSCVNVLVTTAVCYTPLVVGIYTRFFNLMENNRQLLGY